MVRNSLQRLTATELSSLQFSGFVLRYLHYKEGRSILLEKEKERNVPISSYYHKYIFQS